MSYFETLGASNRRQQKASREFGIPPGSGHPPDIGANDHFKQSIVARERHIKSLILKHKQYSR
jgi:hypothetical protein